MSRRMCVSTGKEGTLKAWDITTDGNFSNASISFGTMPCHSFTKTFKNSLNAPGFYGA
ncbi:MAG: hypothetical protein ACFB15_20295 [Cyclobacteriaceae bacterium]